MLCFASVAHATAGSRALLPAAGPALERAFAGLEPALRLDGARLEPDGATLHVCRAAGDCFDISMRAPGSGCTGRDIGAWCIATGLDAAGADGERIVSALSATSAAEIWQDVQVRPPDADKPHAPHPPPPPGLPLPERASLGVALLLLLLLGVAGWGAGRALTVPATRGRATLLLAAPALLVAATEARWAWLDLWDAVAWVLAWSAGWSAGLLRWSRGAIVAGMVGLLLGAFALEGLVRLTRPDVPDGAALGLPPWHRPDPTVSNEYSRTWFWEVYACDYLFGEPPEWDLPRTYLPARGPLPPGTTLHIGDSMLHGMDLSGAETMTAQLRRDGAEHVSLGLPGTSLDVWLMALRRFGPELRPKRIVAHVFPGNDLDELDAPLSCCRGEPLLDRSQAALPPRCHGQAGVVGTEAFTLLVQASPAPYLVRALSPHSRAARHLRRLLRPRHDGRLPPTKRLAAYEATLRRFIVEARAMGAEVQLVVMPDRDVLEGRTPEEGPSGRLKRRLHRVAHQLGVPVHDAWALFTDIPESDRTALFQSEIEHDIHLSAVGTAMVADWLRPRLNRPPAAQPPRTRP